MLRNYSRMWHCCWAAVLAGLLQAAGAQPFGVVAGTENRQCFDTPPGTGDRSSVTVRIAGRNWLSHKLVSSVAQIILEEYLGYTVQILDAYAQPGFLIYEHLEGDHFDFDLEAWQIVPSTPAYNKYVVTDATVLVPNPSVGVGYKGRVGIFILPSAVAKSEFADYYMFYQYDNRAEVKKNDFVMFGEDGLHDFLASEGLEPYCVPEYNNCEPGPMQGYWVPPVCQANPSECGVLLMADPGWDKAYFEQLTYNYNLGLIHAYLGQGSDKHVKALIEAGREVIFYYWEPDPTPQSVNAVRVSYPDHSYGCTAANQKLPDGPVACDYGEFSLLKAFSSTFPRKAPEAYTVLRDMVIYLDQMKSMIQSSDAAGGTLTEFQAACAWVQANADIISAWAPDCIVNPPAVPQDGDLVFDPAILACKVITVLPESEFDYVCDYGTPEPVGTADRSETMLKVVIKGWLTQQFVTTILSLLLRDFLGYRVIVVDGSDRTAAEQGMDLERAVFDFEPESWRFFEAGEMYKTFVVERATVLNPGTIGYSGRSGSFIFPATKQKSRWTSWWRFFKNHTLTQSNGLNFLKFGYQDPDVPKLRDWVTNNGDGLMKCTSPWCTGTGDFEGFWVSPQCEADPTSCILHIQPVSPYDEGYFESLTVNLGMPFVHAYYGWGMEPFVHALQANRTYDAVVYWWEPDPFITKLGAIRLSYPDYTFGCDSAHDFTPFSATACDYQEKLLQKVTSVGARDRAPQSYYLYQRMEFFMNEITAMIGQHTAAGGELTDANEVACWWVRENLDKVQSTFAPDCISKPKAPGTEKLGDFVFDETTLECTEVACLPDEVLDTTNGIVCRRCGDGQLPNEGFTECVPCTVGTTPNRTTGQCDPCPQGSFCSFGAEGPDDCQSGTFTGESGLTECVRCTFGRYQPLAGRSECELCREPMTTAGEGSRHVTDCICPEDNYKPFNVTDHTGHPISDSIQVCQPCPEGMDCKEGSDMVNIPCFDGSFDEGAAASAGAYPVPLARYYTRCKEPLSVFMCITDVACPGGQVQKCAEGFEGIACGRCYDEWYLSGLECIPCKDVEKSKFLFPTLPILAAPCVVMGLYYISRDPVMKWNTPANHLASALFVVLVYIQTIAAMSACYMNKPIFMKDSTEWTSYAFDLLSLLRPTCAVFGDFTVGFIGSLLLPAYAAVLFVAVYFTSVFVGKFNSQWRMDGDILSNCYWSLFNTFFIGICRQTFELFQCYEHPNGERSLRSQGDVLCNSSTWNDIVVVSLAAAVIFCGGFIALNVWIMWVAPYRFHEKTFQKRWKFIFIKFRPSVWWWGLVLLFKGVWLNLPTVVFDYGSAQVFWLGWALITYLMSCFALFPWRGFSVGALDIIMHAFLVGLFGFLPHFVDPYPDGSERDSIGKAYSIFSLTPLALGGYVLAVLLLKRLSVLAPVSSHQWQASADEVCHTFSRLSDDSERLGKIMATLPWFDVMMLQHAGRLIQTEVFFDRKPKPMVNSVLATFFSGTRLKAVETKEEEELLHKNSYHSTTSGQPPATGKAALRRGSTAASITGSSQETSPQDQGGSSPTGKPLADRAPLKGSVEENFQMSQVVDSSTSPRNSVGEADPHEITPRRAAAEVRKLREEVASYEKLQQAVSSFLKQVSPRNLQKEPTIDGLDFPREAAAPGMPAGPDQRPATSPTAHRKKRILPVSPKSPPRSPLLGSR